MVILYCLWTRMFWNARANEVPLLQSFMHSDMFSMGPLNLMKVNDKHLDHHSTLWHCSRIPPENL